MSSTLITRLTEFVSTQTEEPSKKDLENALKEIYKSKKTTKKSNDGEEKQKRKPSAYNIYYAEQSAIIKKKEENMPKEERMTAKDKMSYIAKLWHEKKSGDTSETVQETVVVSDEENEITLAEVEPESKPEVASAAKKPAAKTSSSSAKKSK
jgi:hypothetical protein